MRAVHDHRALRRRHHRWFQHESDAKRFRRALEQRLVKFRLELNAEKTRLIRFGRFAARQRSERGLGRPETFDCLG
jgi:nucleoid DNA-binding protein